MGDPRALRAVSLRRLSAAIDKASLGHSGEEKALAFHVAADQALALWDGDSAVAAEQARRATQASRSTPTRRPASVRSRS